MTITTSNGQASKTFIKIMDHYRAMLRIYRSELLEGGSRTGGRAVPDSDLSDTDLINRYLGKAGNALDELVKELKARQSRK